MFRKEVKFSVSTDTFIRFWMVILGFLAVIAAVWWARTPLMLIAMAFFLTLILNRPVSFIARFLPGKSRAFATLIAYIIIVAMVGALLFSVVPILVHQLYDFVASLSSDQLQSRSGWLYHLLAQYHLEGQVDSAVNSVKSYLGGVVAAVSSWALPAITSTLSFLGNACLVIFLTYFMLVEAPDWEVKFWNAVYSDPERRRHHKAVAKRMYEVFSNYIAGQALVGAISATFTALVVAAMALLMPQIPLTTAAPAWITIFLLIFVPLFGAMIGGIIVTIMLAVYSTPAAIAYIAIFFIEQQVENNIVTPRVQSRRLDMSALLVLAAITIGINVGGLAGALIAIPVAGCCIVLLRDFLHTRELVAARARSAGTDRNMDGVLGADDDRPVIFTADRKKFRFGAKH